MDVTLLVCHELTERIIEKYHSVARAFAGFGDTFLVYQKEKVEDRNVPEGIKSIGFTIDDLCSLGYEAWAETIVPGSNHFILLWFFRLYPDYGRYWNIEYDVEFAGDWQYLFKRFDKSDADLLSCHIMSFRDDPYWYWWKALKTGDGYVPIHERLRSFNPIYRLTAEAMAYLDDKLRCGSGGHHEVVIPTLLDRAGYKLEDLGGKGKFVKPDNFGLHYDSEHPEPWGTMRHKPPISLNAIIPESRMLYHPVK